MATESHSTSPTACTRLRRAARTIAVIVAAIIAITIAPAVYLALGGSIGF